MSCPVHATPTTSKDALVKSKEIKVPEEKIIEMEQVEYPPGPIVNHDEVHGDNVGNNGGNLEERCENIKENLLVTLPEFDDSSLWDEVMGTTDLEKIENPEDLKAGDLEDIFKDLEEDLGLDNFWL